MSLDNSFPIGIFLSLQKSLRLVGFLQPPHQRRLACRSGVKMSYYRGAPMPDFYQTRKVLIIIV